MFPFILRAKLFDFEMIQELHRPVKIEVLYFPIILIFNFKQ